MHSKEALPAAEEPGTGEPWRTREKAVQEGRQELMSTKARQVWFGSGVPPKVHVSQGVAQLMDL
jgi:hypothetical protein